MCSHVHCPPPPGQAGLQARLPPAACASRQISIHDVSDGDPDKRLTASRSFQGPTPPAAKASGSLAAKVERQPTTLERPSWRSILDGRCFRPAVNFDNRAGCGEEGWRSCSDGVVRLAPNRLPVFLSSRQSRLDGWLSYQGWGGSVAHPSRGSDGSPSRLPETSWQTHTDRRGRIHSSGYNLAIGGIRQPVATVGR